MAPSPAPWAVLGDVLWCLGLGCLLASVRDAVRLALGEGALRCFFRDIAAFAAAAVLVCGFAAGASAGGLAPLVYERRAAAGGCMLALDRAARRTPLRGGNRRLPAGTAACGGENRRQAPQKAPCRRPQPPQRAQKGKKVRKKAKIR